MIQHTGNRCPECEGTIYVIGGLIDGSALVRCDGSEGHTFTSKTADLVALIPGREETANKTRHAFAAAFPDGIL